MGLILGVLFASLFLLLALVISLLFWQKYSRFHKLLEKIPGSSSVPLFGTIFDYFGASREELFKRLRRKSKLYYPIWKDWTFNYGVVNIYHPDDIEIILSNPQHINKSLTYSLAKPWLQQGLLTSSGQHWQKRRKMLTPTFHYSALNDYVDVFNEGTAKLIQDLEKKGGEAHFDIIPSVTQMTINCILEVMGTKQDEELTRQYIKAIHEMCQLIVNRVARPWLWFNKTYKLFSGEWSSFKVLHVFTEKTISDRRKIRSSRNKTCLLDLLLKLQKEGANIDDLGIREEAFTFTFAGHDTTSLTICYILLLLANNRKEQDDARQEIIEVLGDRSPNYNDLQQLPFLERCIKECLRLYPVIPAIGRQAEDDIRTATGYIIPKGSLVNFLIYDIHRNTEIYPDPEKFDPDRFLPENNKTRHPFAYIPFSAGPRNCIGQKFGMLEVKAALCGILRKFNLEPVTRPQDLVFLLDIMLRPNAGIYVNFVARQ